MTTENFLNQYEKMDLMWLYTFILGISISSMVWLIAWTVLKC